MKKGWEVKRLDDLCQIELGKTPYRGDKSFWDTGKETNNVWLSIADMLHTNGDVVSDSKEYITDKAAKVSKIVEKGTLLLSFKLTLGRLAFSGKDLFTNEAIAALTIKNEKVIDKYFLYQFLSLYDWDAASEGDVKVKGKTLNKAKLKEIEVHFPKSLPEQQRIVAILDEAFAAIAKAKANAQQNLKNAKELFESYLQGVFENKGEGWEEKTLGEIADVEYGYTDKSTEEGHYRYVRITDIDKNGELILEDKKYIKYSKEAEGFLIQNNDLLMARTGATFAKVLLYNGDEPSVFASYLIRIKFKEKIENVLYWHFTKTKDYWEQANSLQSGAAQPHFNGAAVKQVIFSYPKSTKEQKVLIGKFETLSTETKKLETIYQQKINDLEELKKSVLQKAFSGELSSPEGVIDANDGHSPSKRV